MSTKAKREPLRLRVVAPCNEDWDEMSGGDDIRFCGRCRQNVYNLSEMNETQVRELVQGPVCVRFFVRGDGTVVTRQCPPMLEAARRRLVALGAGFLPLFAGFWGSVAWLRSKMGRQPAPMVVGNIQPPPLPVPPARATGEPPTSPPNLPERPRLGALATYEPPSQRPRRPKMGKRAWVKGQPPPRRDDED